MTAPATEALTPDEFRRLFAVERCGADGVLVNLESGAYFRLNGTAAEACEALQQGRTIDDAAALLATRLGGTSDQARALLDGMAGDLRGGGARDETVGPFRYRRMGNDGYQLLDGDAPVLAVTPDAAAFQLAAALETLRYPLLDYVRAITPKLLAYHGARTLHAAACLLDGAALAFCGASGAGKTSTAQAFGAAGAPVLSEDLLVLAASDPPAVYTAAERTAHAWAADAAERLARDPKGWVSCTPLAHAPSGTSVPLRRIWFLDAGRREADRLMVRPLPPADALVALLRNTFLGTDDPAAWRDHLRQTRALASALELAELIAPRGLPALQAAARAYVTNSAS